MGVPVNIIAVPSVSWKDADAWHEVATASLAEDLPDAAPPSPGQTRTRLTGPALNSRLLVWLAVEHARDGRRAVGAASLRLFDRTGQEHLAEAELHVRPDARRRGTGTRLLSALTTEAVAQGRRSLVVEAPACAPADLFCVRHGFRRALTLHHLLLPLHDVHRGWLDELATGDPPGYRTAEWEGEVPDVLADAFAAAKNAMNDMPVGDLDHGTVGWDADRVRAMAAVVTGRGDTLLTVAALHGDGVAGFTELVLPGGPAAVRAQQYDTVVVPAHRGRGLGVWLKAQMLCRLHDEHPQVVEIETDNAADNVPMLAVNEQLGFRRVRTSHRYQLALTEG
ncbi:GNAT family N-acetyltransferase [Streptomyces smyrnaeus]|uniref:GNAT family N-acetyltransferase n=1 Tax=Streptomyces smyrnaeus TaxID=1387713 RepID=UPI0036C3DEDE